MKASNDQLDSAYPIMRKNVDAISSFDRFVGQLEQRAASDDSSIVDQHIDFSDFLLHQLRHCIDLFLIANVNNVRCTFEAFRDEGISSCFDGCNQTENVSNIWRANFVVWKFIHSVLIVAIKLANENVNGIQSIDKC